MAVPPHSITDVLHALAVPTLLAELQRRLLGRELETWDEWRARFVAAAKGDSYDGGGDGKAG